MADPTIASDAPGEAKGHTEVAAGAGHQAEPSIGGFIDATAVVALAMTVVILILVWKKVPSAIGKSLDKKIAAIREQLAEAEALRKDAEALKSEYEAKAAAADQEAAAMVERARHEAEAIIAKASEDAAALVERRKAMAEATIAAEERAAIDDLRATAAKAAAAAATRLIAERNDASTDKPLVDRAIASLTK
jgi:F-type H+-transporting ATPase subunit b